ncbi:hypothetical protein PFISCL1PPCAC_20426 [Pristionchus fissidentatus]|uniref:Tyrosine-protein kinase n=1 Tax=Pristionchus fissidentatus TaxID=1538716 RepID=A0AAV5WEI6_9BILA|nr:hypothetical protein PFISCL1PPCAC_20426 [Pristionchus fissidentatus]
MMNGTGGSLRLSADFPASTSTRISPLPLETRNSSSNVEAIRPHAPWFHGNISRETTERLLNRRADGTFLVRESTNFPGDFTLSLAFRGKVEHYRIYQTAAGLTCDNEEFFANLIQLVSHYKREPDGLCHRLLTPVISEGFHVAAQADIEQKMAFFRGSGLSIPSVEIQLGDVIGHGEFGDVLMGVYRGQKVAVKRSKRLVGGVSDELLDEAKFVVGLSHRRLVALVGVVLDDVAVYMVTEYMANGSLVDFLRSRGRHQLERRQLMQFSLDIAEGMCYLESVGVVHRDLAARNVLLDVHYTAKISDFGLAKDVNSPGGDSSTGKFPIKWTAPEALRQSKFSTKSDVWSFGILLWEIFSFGRVPYPRIPIQDVVRHIERGYRMEAPEGCPAEITRLMHDTWHLTPNDRPAFNQILHRLVGLQQGYGL